MVEIVPPMLKSLTTRRSPFLWTPVKVWPAPTLVVPRPIGFWKNQNAFCASPLLSNRSMPKKTTLQVGPPPAGHVVALAGRLYRAAKPFRRTSLPGRPPAPWFQAQLLMSIGSLEPPPVKVVPPLADWEANSSAVAPFVLLVVEQSEPTTCWQTRSQPSGGPVPACTRTALPSAP